MKRKACAPRENWKELVEKTGFDFHTNVDGTTYWKDSFYYEFTSKEKDDITTAIESLHEACLQAIPRILADQSLMDRMRLPSKMEDIIRRSWENDRHRYVYGRFDLLFDQNDEHYKLLEYNADTPTTLLEAGHVQKEWADYHKQEQFNSLRRMLLIRWWHVKWRCDLWNDTVYFSSIKDCKEDEGTAKYMMNLAKEAGIKCQYISIEDISYNDVAGYFVDKSGNRIRVLWKLYPWEWLMQEEFFAHVDKLVMIEPAWKLLLSNKALLPILYEMFPHHKNILPAFFTREETVANGVNHFISKPLYGREGANMCIEKEGSTPYKSLDQGYVDDGYVYQKMCLQEDIDGFHHVIGGWVIGDKAAGISIREDSTLVTTNVSQFVPHCVKDIV